ncbi:MAG TPA: Calx-beta domain-containing protein, partial [Verrucomicrobiae bacterium]
FQICLLNVTNALLGPRTNAMLYIADNDLGGVIQFSTTNYLVTETGITAHILITRSGGFASGVTVDFTTSDGTASGGSDYANSSRTLVFNAGEISKTVLVPIFNDSIDEPNETVLLSLSNPTGGASLGPRANAVLTITDDDAGGTIQFSATSYSVSELSNAVKLVVNRSNGIASGVSVDFQTVMQITGLVATADLDYVSTNGTLYFASNELSKVLYIPILDDQLPEGNESFRVVLSNPQGGAVLGLNRSALVTIIDDESSLQFARSSYTNNEGLASFTVTVTRTGPNATLATVDYVTKDGSAVAGEDYTAKAGRLTFTPGLTSQTISVVVSNDTFVEGTEYFQLCLLNVTNALLGPTTNANLYIIDNDLGGAIQFSATSITGTEGTVASVTLSRVGGLATGISVQVNLNPVTATPDQDFTFATETVFFNANETNKTIQIPLLNDTQVDDGELFQLFLSDPQGGATLAANSNVLVKIKNNYQASGFAPDNVQGKVVKAVIGHGTGPFASAGTFIFSPSTLDSSFRTFPQTSTLNIDEGTYTYQKTGPNTGLLIENNAPSGEMVHTYITFSSATAGTFASTNDAMTGFQTGTFTVPDNHAFGFALDSVAGWTAVNHITSGSGVFSPSGTGNIIFFPDGSYSDGGGGGTYWYVKTGANTASVLLFSNVGFTISMQVTYTGPTTGAFSSIAIGDPGTQTGTFILQ